MRRQLLQVHVVSEIGHGFVEQLQGMINPDWPWIVESVESTWSCLGAGP